MVGKNYFSTFVTLHWCAKYWNIQVLCEEKTVLSPLLYQLLRNPRNSTTLSDVYYFKRCVISVPETSQAQRPDFPTLLVYTFPSWVWRQSAAGEPKMQEKRVRESYGESISKKSADTFYQGSFELRFFSLINTRITTSEIQTINPSTTRVPL